MHLICPPKFCISIVFNFSWGDCNTQENEKQKLCKFWGEANKVHYGRCASGELLILLDPSAAFGTVNYSLLLSRLPKRYGLCGTALNWLESYVCNLPSFSTSMNHIQVTVSFQLVCLKGLFWVPYCTWCIQLLSVMLSRAIILIIIMIYMLMKVTFTSLLKQMIHPRSKTGLKAVSVIFVVGWIAIILSWTKFESSWWPFPGLREHWKRKDSLIW